MKTVHSGFFANQGEVETIEESSDENDGSKKKGSGGGDGDFVQKRKKVSKPGTVARASCQQSK